MHNEERERRDNRPNSAHQVASARAPTSSQTGGRPTDSRLVSPQVAQKVAMPSRPTPAAAAAVKKKPVHLNRDDAVRLQLNLSDADEVMITQIRYDMNYQK